LALAKENEMSERAKLYVSLTFLFALSACATGPSAPIQAGNESAGVGLSVKVVNSMVVPITYKADAVYFAKHCVPSEPCDSNIYISNYAKDGRIYWLDAPPGEYAAVATSFRQFADPNNYITYFPEELIQKTVVRVEKGRFTYLGDFALDMFLGICPDKADKSQVRYAELFAPNTAKCGFMNIVGGKLASTPVVFIGNQFYAAGAGDYHYRGAIRQFGRDSTLMHEFISNARKDLEGKGWDSRLEQAGTPQ
jgi:hypothetical protein